MTELVKFRAVLIRLELNDRVLAPGREAKIEMVITSKVDAVLFGKLKMLFGTGSVPRYIDIVARIASDD